MKKSILFFLFTSIVLIFLNQKTIAQDLLVTTKGDSINCLITAMNDRFVAYSTVEKNHVVSASIPKKEVLYFQKNYFKQPLLSKKAIDSLNHYPWLRLAVQGSLCQRLAEPSAALPLFLQNYYKQLKNGKGFNINVQAYPARKIGMGVVFNSFFSNAELKNISLIDSTGKVTQGNFSDKVRMLYIAPAVSLRLMSKNKMSHINIQVAAGLLSYRDNAVQFTPVVFKSNTVGTMFEIAVDQLLTPELAVGLAIGGNTGSLTAFNVKDNAGERVLKLNPATPESLSWLHFSLGVRYLY